MNDMVKLNMAIGALILTGFCVIILGIMSKLTGIPLLAPYVLTSVGCFVVAIACFVLALVVDKFGS
ncbi:MAG: hypothetical protein ABH885_04385 [Candidatus Omnitrophota bacterium]